MEYFYIPELSPDIRMVEVKGPEAKHMVKVLRYKSGDEILATNGRGELFRAVITRLQRNGITVRVTETVSGDREPRHQVALAPAILKGDKLSTVVEAVTELGVREILPFVSTRVIGRLSEAKLRRMRLVAVSGMKTAMRTVLPNIKPFRDWGEFLSSFECYDQVVIAYEEEKNRGLDQVLNTDAKSVMVVIGPEGGFTQEEAQTMAAAGGRLFSLGLRRLRAETAAIAAVALCLNRLGDLK